MPYMPVHRKAFSGWRGYSRTLHIPSISDLGAALEDEDEPRVLLVALRRIAEARGGIAKVAKLAGVERESLYRRCRRTAILAFQLSLP